MKVTFPNESYPVEVSNFKWNEFKPTNIFEDVVFGWWGDTYIKISKSDYQAHTNKLKK